MTTITRTLAEFAAGLDYDKLPADVSERTCMLILDHIGIALRARNEADLRGPMQAGLEALGMNSGTATVIGDGHGYLPGAAALFNGNLGHSLDFDDTHARSPVQRVRPVLSVNRRDRRSAPKAILVTRGRCVLTVGVKIKR